MKRLDQNNILLNDVSKSVGESGLFGESTSANYDDYRKSVLDRVKGTSYESLAALNPYVTYDYNPTIWDSIGDAFGFNTEEDDVRMQYQKAAREYDAQISQLMFENQYNSEESKTNRMNAAGLNSDLLGTSGASEAGEFAQEQTSPDTKVGSSFNDFANVVMNALGSTMNIMNTFNGFRKTASDLETAQLTRDSIKQGMDLHDVETISKLVDIANPIVKAGLSLGVSPSSLHFNEGGSLLYGYSNEKGESVVTPTEYSLPIMKVGNRYAGDLIKYANALLHQSSTIADVQGDMLKSQKNSEELQTHRDSSGNFGYSYDLPVEGNWMETSMRDISRMSYQSLMSTIKAQKKQGDYNAEYYDKLDSSAAAASANAQNTYTSDVYSGMDGSQDAALHNIQTSNQKSMATVSSLYNKEFEKYITDLHHNAENGDFGSAVMLFLINQMVNTGSMNQGWLTNSLGNAAGAASKFISPIKVK